MSKFTKLSICAIVALFIIVTISSTAFAGDAQLVARQDDPAPSETPDASIKVTSKDDGAAPEITPDATADAAPAEGKTPAAVATPVPSGTGPGYASKIASAINSVTAGASMIPPQPSSAPKYTSGSGSDAKTAPASKSAANKIESGLISVAAIAAVGLFYL
ncbi:4981_t:CDS:2 [Funneliformis geosporum]|uniref:19341_t:CDS:1 n=1 Tax=Funneliformis geosporum TaxID=1117311 RepID=A0A9W4SKB6_9GLOM|nr:4981_t:CDS:2 [Funneliformis geosporum]CAI2171560.1 19341_t:CDS:2 [Funneliformis geosporum]